MITIPPEVYISLKKKIQIDTLALLASSGEPVRQQELLEAFPRKTNNARLGDTLQILVLLGHVRQIEKNGIVLYQAVATAKVQNVSAKVQNVPCEVQNVPENVPTLTLTNYELTNKQDFEIFKDTQAEGESSPPVATERVTAPSGVPDGVGEAVAVESAAPAPISRRLSPEEFAGIGPDIQVIVPGKPLTSHFRMIANMDGKTVYDPDHVPKSPVDAPPPIPMYDAWVKIIKRLWRLVLSKREPREKLPFDFIIHRAAYMFAMESHLRTGEVYDSPETFMEHVKNFVGTKPMYPKMAGLLQDQYMRAGLYWDKTPLDNADVYKAETAYAEYKSKELGVEVLPRDEAFPSTLHQRELLRFRVDKKHREQSRRQEDAERLSEREKLHKENQQRAELERAAKAEHKEAEIRQAYLNEVEQIERMTARERKAYFVKTPKVILECYKTNMSPDLWERFIALRPQRKEVLME